MDLKKRAFLKHGFMGAASLVMQRYGVIMQVLELPDSQKVIGRLTKEALKDYYHLSSAVQSLTIGYEDQNFNLGDELNLSSTFDLTVHDVPNLSQRGLQQTYVGTIDSLNYHIEEIVHILKYGDNIDQMLSAIEDNREDLFADDGPASRTFLDYELLKIRDSFGTLSKTENTLAEVVKQHFRHLTLLQRHMTKDTLQGLAEKVFVRLPGIDSHIPYLFDQNRIGDVIESISLNSNGVCLGQFQLSDTFKPLLRMAAESDEAKNKLAKHIIWGDKGFFNFQLAQEHGLEEHHFRQGLRNLIQENTELKVSETSNNAESLQGDLEDLGIPQDHISKDLEFVEEEITTGRLVAKKLRSFEEEGGLYEFVFIDQDEQNSGIKTDRLTDIVCTLLAHYGYNLKRVDNYQIRILITPHMNNAYQSENILNNYCKQSEFSNSFKSSSVSKLLSKAGWEGQTISGVVEDAKTLKLIYV